jgi:hypothetical protein
MKRTEGAEKVSRDGCEDVEKSNENSSGKTFKSD